MENLKITWTFSRPVIVSQDHPIHLDALLAWAKVNEAEKEYIDDPYSAQEILPLGKKDGVWQASQLIFTPESQKESLLMTKRFSLDEFAQDYGNIYHPAAVSGFKSATGRFKAFNWNIYFQWMKTAEAWCVGETTEIERLLSKIKYIGKLRRNCFGTIKTMTIEPDQTAEKNWMVRSLKAPSGGKKKKGYALAVQRSCPPYWDRVNIEDCFVPIEPEELIVRT